MSIAEIDPTQYEQEKVPRCVVGTVPLTSGVEQSSENRSSIRYNFCNALYHSLIQVSVRKIYFLHKI